MPRYAVYVRMTTVLKRVFEADSEEDAQEQAEDTQWYDGCDGWVDVAYHDEFEGVELLQEEPQ